MTSLRSVLLTFWMAIALGGCVATPQSSPGPTLPPPASPSVAPVSSEPSATPIASQLCVEETRPAPSALLHACRGAIAAFYLVAAPLPWAIKRVVIWPGGFGCGGFWPGVGPEIVCLGGYVPPGAGMHGWMSFVGTDLVAAVGLQRDLPFDGSLPTKLPPWTATLLKLAVPPTGWTMP